MGAARVRSIANLGPKIGAYFEANSMCYREIPCAAEQGIFSARTGNMSRLGDRVCAISKDREPLGFFAMVICSIWLVASGSKKKIM